MVVAAVTYGVPRILRPDMFPGEQFFPGLAHDLDRVFFHLDFGCAGILAGCPQMLLVPWIVLGAPLGAMCLRLTLSITREAMDEDFVRTAEAKGVRPHDIVRRHAAPLSFPGTFSFIAVSAPLIITNMVLVERTLSVPGFLKYTWRASGHANPGRDPVPDFPLLCALGLWGPCC